MNKIIFASSTLFCFATFLHPAEAKTAIPLTSVGIFTQKWIGKNERASNELTYCSIEELQKLEASGKLIRVFQKSQFLGRKSGMQKVHTLIFANGQRIWLADRYKHEVVLLSNLPQTLEEYFTWNP